MLLLFKKGSLLLEVIIILIFVGLFMAGLCAATLDRMSRQRIHVTLSDMAAITDAALDYRVATFTWPAALSDLQPEYLTEAIKNNPFGNPYILNCESGRVSVSSTVPSGLAGDGLAGSLLEVTQAEEGKEVIRITRREPVGSVTRPKYDKKHFYRE